MQPVNRIRSTVLFILLSLSTSWGQDSVDVTFRYYYSGSGFPSGVSVPGEFNGWNRTDPKSLMTYKGSNVWILTKRLPIGGNPNAQVPTGVPGAWQYKFYAAQFEGKAWPNDSLNHHENLAEGNHNSYIVTKDPTIYHLLPNQRNPIVKSRAPTITAYIFPKVGAAIDTSKLALNIDGVSITGIGASYNVAARQLVYPVPTPLVNGSHTLILNAGSSVGGTNADTVTFITQGGFVQITTQGGYATRNPLRQIRGSVLDPAIRTMKIVRNNVDTMFVTASVGAYDTTVTLVEGLNTFKAIVDTGSTSLASDPISFTYLVNHTPYARATVSPAGSTVTLSAAPSSDPDGQTLTNFKWIDEPAQQLGLTGRTGVSVSIPKPSTAGEYYFGLIATDPNGNADTTRSYFIIKSDGTLQNPTIASNPEWAKRARVYFLFPRAASSRQDLKGAMQRLQYIRDLGFNVVWVMPVMKNAFTIDLNYGPGYNIVDFYNVAPEYGTNQDFKNFVDQAHALGLKVILDVTPNHTSRSHPWSVDAHTFKQDSRYWTWYEHSIIPHNDNGLGQSLDAGRFNYYSGFSDQLLNINWKDIDARTEMINVYKYWIQNFGIDGYRFDVYWGPHRRYGEQYMGMPVREALKHIKPDILLLAEDDGTGVGTETIYADYSSNGINGGVDAAYDFKLYFNQIRNFAFTGQAVNNLHNEIFNGGYYPGPNSLYMRFMESQDEDRIYYAVPGGQSPPSTYFDSDPTTAFRKTMPMVTVVFTVPGFPMIWNGQEVGWGYGISGPTKEARNRSIINWSFQGRTSLTPHYQRLAQIRGQFPAFSTQQFGRIPSSNPIVYAIVRPFVGEDGIAVVNFSSSSVQSTVSLSSSNLATAIQNGRVYYLNDLYNDTSYVVQFSGGAADVNVTLSAYGSSIFVLSDSIKRVDLPVLTAIQGAQEKSPRPSVFQLYQNYPNPFNPSTTITYDLPSDVLVSLKIYNVLGEEIATLLEEYQRSGVHSVRWSGGMNNGRQASSGVYFVRLKGGNYSDTKKIILLR